MDYIDFNDKITSSGLSTPEHKEAREEFVTLIDHLNEDQFGFVIGDDSSPESLLDTLYRPFFQILEDNGLEFDDGAREDFIHKIQSCHEDDSWEGLLRVRFQGHTFCLPVEFEHLIDGGRRVELSAPMQDLDELTADFLLSILICGVDEITLDSPEVIRHTYSNLLWSAGITKPVFAKKVSPGGKPCLYLYKGLVPKAGWLIQDDCADEKTCYLRLF